jgi:peptidoglycan hydrolase CwlO-like protein
VQAGILDLDSDIVRVQAGVSDLDKDMDTVHAGIKDLDADIEEMSEEEEAEKQTSNTTDISTSLKNIHSALNKLAEEIERLKK